MPLFQRVNCTRHPPAPTPNKQKNSLSCLFDIPIFREDRNVLWIFKSEPHPPPPKKKKQFTTHIPKYSYILQNPIYYRSITLEFKIDSKPLWLPTKDLVFFRFIIFMYYPHIKTFNKIKTFSDLPYIIYPCNSKRIFFFLASSQCTDFWDDWLCISKLPISTKCRYSHLSPNPNFHVVVCRSSHRPWSIVVLLMHIPMFPPRELHEIEILEEIMCKHGGFFTHICDSWVGN